VAGINAVTLAAHEIDPSIQVRVIWVNGGYDPGREEDAAKAHIDQGAGIIVQHTDSRAAVQVAEERGLMAFGQASDMRRFGPNVQLTAIVDRQLGRLYCYVSRARAVLNGIWKSHAVWMGIKDGAVEIAPYGPKVPEAVRKAADAVEDGIVAGTPTRSPGPIKDQKGVERDPAGPVRPTRSSKRWIGRFPA